MLDTPRSDMDHLISHFLMIGQAVESILRGEAVSSQCKVECGSKILTTVGGAAAC